MTAYKNIGYGPPSGVPEGVFRAAMALEACLDAAVDESREKGLGELSVLIMRVTERVEVRIHAKDIQDLVLWVHTNTDRNGPVTARPMAPPTPSAASTDTGSLNGIRVVMATAALFLVAMVFTKIVAEILFAAGRFLMSP